MTVFLHGEENTLKGQHCSNLNSLHLLPGLGAKQEGSLETTLTNMHTHMHMHTHTHTHTYPRAYVHATTHQLMPTSTNRLLTFALIIDSILYKQ